MRSLRILAASLRFRPPRTSEASAALERGARGLNFSQSKLRESSRLRYDTFIGIAAWHSYAMR